MTPTEEKARSASLAAQDLQTIEDLKAFEPFTAYFLRRLAEKIKARELKALSPDTSAEDTMIEKKIIAALRSDAENLLASDEAGCRSILSQ
jgi:hypothetical protein